MNSPWPKKVPAKPGKENNPPVAIVEPAPAPSTILLMRDRIKSAMTVSEDGTTTIPSSLYLDLMPASITVDAVNEFDDHNAKFITAATESFVTNEAELPLSKFDCTNVAVWKILKALSPLSADEIGILTADVGLSADAVRSAMSALYDGGKGWLTRVPGEKGRNGKHVLMYSLKGNPPMPKQTTRRTVNHVVPVSSPLVPVIVPTPSTGIASNVVDNGKVMPISPMFISGNTNQPPRATEAEAVVDVPFA